MNLAVYGINGRNYLLLERLKSNDGDEYLYFQSENNGEYLIRKVMLLRQIRVLELNEKQ